MTTLRDRPEPGADDRDESPGLDVAHCPHCGGEMETGVRLPWPTVPALCRSCDRWVGRARAVSPAAAKASEPVAGGGEPSSSRRRSHSRRRPSRPGPAERRRARELGPPPVPRFLAPDDGGAGDTFHDDGFAATTVWDAPAAAPPPSPVPDPVDDPAVAPGRNGAGADLDRSTAQGDDHHPLEPDPPTAVGSPPAAATGLHEGGEELTSPPPPASGAAAPAEEVPEGDRDGRAPEPIESLPAPEGARPLPFWAVPSEPEPPRRLSLRRLRPRLGRPTRAGVTRALPFVLLVLGGLLLVEGALTVLWKEPFSALFTARTQSALGDDLEKLERASAEASRNRREFNRLQRRQSVKLNRETGTSKPIGRLRIDRIGLNEVVVQGTDEITSLQKGPGHYTETPLPGQKGKWTVGIAGHRTTYGAPFRNVNKLERGDKIVFSVPYGRYTYEVARTKIVDAGYSKAFVPQGGNQIVLTACHPLYSDAQRILVYGKLTKAEPRKSARRA